MKKSIFLHPLFGGLLKVFQLQSEENKIKKLARFLGKKGYHRVKFSRVLLSERQDLGVAGRKVKAKVYCFHTYIGEKEGYEVNRRSEEQYIVELRGGGRKHFYLFHPDWYVVGDIVSPIIMAKKVSLSGSSGATTVSLDFPSTELNFSTTQAEEIMEKALK